MPKMPKSYAKGYVPPKTGIFAVVPPSWVPYAELMRLDRSAGYYAFYWHYAIGIGFAASIAYPRPDISTVLALAAYLACWVVVLRGAVCTINDNFDQDFDRQVARTKFRPIARGAVSTAQGHVFFAAQITIGGLMLWGWSNQVIVYASIITAILSVYPLGKRITNYPQVILGFGFAVPIFLCCAALEADHILTPTTHLRPEGQRSILASVCLYGACGLWTIIFDTVYAHQDLQDDIRAGVKSLAVRLGDQTKFWLGFLAAIQVALLVLTGILCRFTAVYYILTCGGSAVALTSMLRLVNLKVPASCAWWFGPGSRLIGASIFSGLAGQYLTRFT